MPTTIVNTLAGATGVHYMTQPKATETIDLAKLVRVYRRIRDAREQLKAKFKEEDDALKNQLDTVSGELLSYCDTHNTEGSKTTEGTFYRTTRSRYWAADKQAFNDFVLENRLLDLLESRVHQGNLKEFLKENPDTVIPGLMSESTYTIGVRKPKS